MLCCAVFCVVVKYNFGNFDNFGRGIRSIGAFEYWQDHSCTGRGIGALDHSCTGRIIRVLAGALEHWSIGALEHSCIRGIGAFEYQEH